MRRSVVAVGVAGVVVAGSVAGVVAASGGERAVAPVAAALAAGPKLVVPVNFPDPDVIKVGKTYYGYATNARGRNLPVATAAKAGGPWTVRGVDGLPKLGAWARTGLTWAPDVARRKDGSFVLYYTARHKVRNVQCIGVAVAKAATGPFVPVGKGPLVCDAPAGAVHKGIRPELIDAGSVQSKGKRYLLFKVGYNAHGKRSFLALQRMSDDGLKKVGKAKVVLAQSNEPYTVEAPDLVERKGRFVLFYSAGVFSKTNYQTRYAVASKIGGPYRKAAKPLMTSNRQVTGPGGADVVFDGGVWRVFFHGAVTGAPPRPDPSPGGDGGLRRGMYLADLHWSKSGTPYVR